MIASALTRPSLAPPQQVLRRSHQPSPCMSGSISKIAVGYRQGRSVAYSSERHHACERHEGPFSTSWECFKVDGTRRPCCHWPSMLKEKGGCRSDIRNE
ncbi:uncharacterized protein BDW47DRAFT_101784 [Aspergillus candidus]|uniref:Uncharacterized protein n=1 Tax=Aspergillus candidus TaxID=41067 RepID=A0A2I2FI61_ASPCN|nr:hypothetical protein BDW47DRAFT_101784 [Aspergillus candidus]PLB40321.1 hypothetical protein BDW47DRAFT_101784 [Aspergillus candidus]